MNLRGEIPQQLGNPGWNSQLRTPLRMRRKGSAQGFHSEKVGTHSSGLPESRPEWEGVGSVIQPISYSP